MEATMESGIASRLGIWYWCSLQSARNAARALPKKCLLQNRERVATGSKHSTGSYRSLLSAELSTAG